MIYFIGIPLFVVSIVLLVLGGAQNKPWALYALKVIWVFLSAVAAYFAVEAWRGSSHSENWAMIGLIFIAWPAVGLIVLSALAELLLLKGKCDFHATINRRFSLVIVLVSIALAISPLVLGEIMK
jgi:hypothetical protein